MTASICWLSMSAVVQLERRAHRLDAARAQLGVEVRQRLVEQEGDRPAHDGAADGDTLTLAAGKLAGAALQQLFDLEHSRRLGDARGDFRIWQASVLQPGGGK